MRKPEKNRWGHQSSGARAPELWCPLSSWLIKSKLSSECHHHQMKLQIGENLNRPKNPELISRQFCTLVTSWWMVEESSPPKLKKYILRYLYEEDTIYFGAYLIFFSWKLYNCVFLWYKVCIVWECLGGREAIYLWRVVSGKHLKFSIFTTIQQVSGPFITLKKVKHHLFDTDVSFQTGPSAALLIYLCTSHLAAKGWLCFP